ncbi:hypothetical protein C7S16_2548 [Burkholderia thailandensis]|uniref:Uncharacterized protein n=1 Tax=Burkholderia thailandensis TaxID=57975 RepID=A0AAW9D1X1_BURTH|nr:hypothetical protein [Burkholderia thailandensis]MDW9255378.1 hypothetical protein [Burkholderia thailandensis]
MPAIRASGASRRAQRAKKHAVVIPALPNKTSVARFSSDQSRHLNTARRARNALSATLTHDARAFDAVCRRLFPALR